MAFLSLARKYRPAHFHELVGQEFTVNALTNAIMQNRLPQAMILTGVRGIGKTTTARLYARALNCTQGPTAEPCGACESCAAIMKGCHEDVLEVDGASHTGVDEVRRLQEVLQYRPQRSQYRVIIIDEVHMLSQSAFNALLKTLEEPPEQVVFIFATTELQKLPETILSRCQVYHLSGLSTKAIAERLTEILKVEQVSFDPEAIWLVAAQGNSSMRDALTFLDQVILAGGGEVRAAAIRDLTQPCQIAELVEFLQAWCQRDAQKLLSAVEVFDQRSLGFAALSEELVRCVRHSFVIKSVGTESLAIERLGLEAAELAQLKGLAEVAGDFELHTIFRQLTQMRKEFDGSGLDRFVFENNILEWCLDPGIPDVDTLLAAFGGNSQSLGTNTSVAAQVPSAPLRIPSVAARAPQPTQEVKSVPSVTTELVWPESWSGLVEQWKQKSPVNARLLEETAAVLYSPEQIKILVNPGTMAAYKLEQPGIQQSLGQELKKFFSFTGQFTISLSSRQIADAPPQTLLDQKRLAQEQRAAQIRADSEKSVITQKALELFNGKVERVELKSP